MMKLTRKQRLDMVEGLYAGWKTREELRRHTFPVEALDGNIDLLSELTEQTFKSDLDMRRKVSRWIEEKEERLKTQEEKRKKYFKARLKKIKAEAEAEERRVKENFKKELFATCVSRYKKKTRKRLKRVCRKAGTPVVQ